MQNQQDFLFLIGSIRQASRRHADKLLKKYKLSRYEWLVLACLKNCSIPPTQSYIKDYIGIDNSYLTKVLDKLENRGYIIKVIGDKDRRNKIIHINPKQSKKINHIFKILNNFNTQILNSLDKVECNYLVTSLKKIQVELDEIANKLHI